MQNRDALLRRLRGAAALIFVALYVVGLVAMLTSNVQLGLILWVISTLGGGGMLYWMKKARERSESASGDPDAGDK